MYCAVQELGMRLVTIVLGIFTSSDCQKNNRNLFVQVCLCVLVRHKPRLAPQVVASAPSLLSPPRRHATPQQLDNLLSSTVTLLTALPNLCSPAGTVVTFFYFSTIELGAA